MKHLKQPKQPMKMIHPRDCVKQISADIGVSQTITVVCPFCDEDHKEQGRPSHWRPERSCSVTKKQFGILYHCFRAGCIRGSGFIPSISYEAPTKERFIPNEYTYDTRALCDKERDILREIVGFSDDQIMESGVRYNPDRDTFVFPIRDVWGYDVGVVDRDFTGRRKPKAISYWHNDVVKLHFVSKTSGVAGKGGSILVVEDIPSAVRASRYTDCCALLGSHINPVQCSHLSGTYNKLILALDNDAFIKAIKLRSKLGYYFDTFEMLYLTKDIKDLTDEEIQELLSESTEIH